MLIVQFNSVLLCAPKTRTIISWLLPQKMSILFNDMHRMCRAPQAKFLLFILLYPQKNSTIINVMVSLPKHIPPLIQFSAV